MYPLISIITPVYNAENYIRDCINSVLSQSYQNWELILIDDCSVDKSVDIINEYLNNNRIKLIKNSINSGAAYSRNKGIKCSDGDYIAFIDSDDIWDKNKLSIQLQGMLDKDVVMSYTSYSLINMKGEFIKFVDVNNEVDYYKLLKENQIKTSTLMLKRDFIGKNKFPNIRHEDYAFFLDLLKNTKFAYKVGHNLTSYRVSNGSLSSNKLKSALWTWRIYREYEKLGLFSSLKYFIHYAFNGIVKYKIKQ